MDGDMFGLAEGLDSEVVEAVQEEAFEPTPVEEPSEPAALEETPPAVEPKADPGFVPIGVVLDERDKRKQLERQLEEYRQRQEVPAPEPVDPWTDLDGALAQRDQQYQQALFQQKLEMSRRFAEMQHGKEEVATAVEWARALCDSDQAFNHKVFTSSDPIGLAVEQYRKEQIASAMTMDDFKAFQAWKAAQSNPQPQAVQPVPAQPAPSPAPLPPRSLASTQSAGAPSLPKSSPEEERLAKMF
jgi:hypothetical protein